MLTLTPTPGVVEPIALPELCSGELKMTCAPSEDSDQPGHLPSLISLHCPHEESLDPYLRIKRTAKALIRLGGCPG